MFSKGKSPLHFEDPVLMTPFVRQIIIDFSNNQSGHREEIRRKWDDQHPDIPCGIINGWEFLEDSYQSRLKKFDGPVRIYIYASWRCKL